VLWTPDENLPADNSANQEDTFYPEIYYGDYGSYYNTPWWNTITYSINQNGYIRDTSRAENFVRNNDGGRGTSPRNVLTTPPPARVEPNNSNSGSTNNSDRNTSTSNSNNNRVETTNTGNNSSSRSGNTKNNSVRNNNGSRNTNGRR